MEVLKLRVQFDGYYGGNVDETMLLPLDVNGVLFEELEDGEYDKAVYLGEIAGKHSECYGDLSVETIDLDTLSVKDVVELIEKADMSEFEMCFESMVSDFAEDEDSYDEEKVEELFKKYDVEDDWVALENIYHIFIGELRNKYDKELVTVTILKSDLERVEQLMKDGGVEII